MYEYLYCQPLGAIFVAAFLIIVLYAVLILALDKYKAVRIINAFLFFASVFIVLDKTIFSRNGNVFQLELRPFYSFVMAQVQPEIYRSVFMNVILFMPFGVTMPYVLSKQYKKRNVLITALSAFLLSSAVEFSQYYFSLGRCETDDVIFNTLGAFIGALGYWLFGYLLKESENMENKLTQLHNVLCDLCANTLFGKKISIPADVDTVALLTEAKHQAILPIAFTALKKQSINNEVYENTFLRSVVNNIRISCNHTQIANILSENKIEYVFIKGVASASYYVEPDIRTMGDVDVLIKRADIKTVNDLLLTLGYSTDEDIYKEDGHIAYNRKLNGELSVCEVHFSVNGIPNSLADVFDSYLVDIFENAKSINVANKECLVPSDFHHGIIILLHTATHLTNEGIGLRHLCDWAVFVNRFSDAEFERLFKTPLQGMGMWRFAQLLTLCCEKYLHIEHKEWTGLADEDLLDAIISDIINGGNFGFKNVERYSQIKYISNRESQKVSQRGALLQAFSNINAKAKTEYGFVKKCKLLLPLGWLAVVFDYFILVLTRRRRLDSINTISGAKHRQSIYKEFELFENGRQ